MAVSSKPSAADLAEAGINTSTQNLHPHHPNSARYYSVEASDPLLRGHVFSLRYASYIAGGYIEANPNRIFTDKYDSQPNCTSYLTYHNASPMGSIRLCRYTPNEGWEIPVMNAYAEEIKKEVGLDKPLLEANRFAVHPGYQRRGGVRARFSIYRNIPIEAAKAETHCILAAVREEHVRFYKMLQFVPISDCKAYSELKFKTILMACFDLEKSRQLVLAQTDRKE